jgi:hypothetical protein
MRALLLGCAAALALTTGCQRQQQAATNQAAPPLPDAGAEPAAAPAPEPASPEQAVAASQAQEQAAPAAAFEVSADGAAVQAAEDASHDLRLKEGPRTYFYRAGQAAPYLVREGDYAYAFKDGRLSGVVDRRGRPVDDKHLGPRRTEAEKILSRGRDLKHAADQRQDGDRGQRSDRRQAPSDEPGRAADRHGGQGEDQRTDHASQPPTDADRHTERDSGRDTSHRADARTTHRADARTPPSGPDADRDQVADRAEHRR